MAKTYVPTLIKLLRRLNVYLSKHSSTIEAAGLSPTQLACITSLISAVANCSSALGLYVEQP